jgi:hypothetical protein
VSIHAFNFDAVTENFFTVVQITTLVSACPIKRQKAERDWQGAILQHYHAAFSVAYQIKTSAQASRMEDIVCRPGFNDLI